MSHLRTERGVRALLCEGGPHLHAELIEGGLVDELFVTRRRSSPAAPGPGWSPGSPERQRPLELAWLLTEEATGELFGRYRTAG